MHVHINSLCRESSAASQFIAFVFILRSLRLLNGKKTVPYISQPPVESKRVCVWAHLSYSPFSSQSLTRIFLSMVILFFFFVQKFPFALLLCQFLICDWLLRKR